MLEYYLLWRFKHPNANDFVRVAEKVSDMKLDWNREYWINSTKTIDYSIDSLWEEGGKTKIRIRRVGDIPMPIDFQLTFKDGRELLHTNVSYVWRKAFLKMLPFPVKYMSHGNGHTTYIIESSLLGDISMARSIPH
jgi:hypothetical protein